VDVPLFNDPREFALLAGGFPAADPLSTTVIGVRVDNALSGVHPAPTSSSATSTAIYQAIGYLRDHDFEERSFIA
jgi:hypothetical protein